MNILGGQFADLGSSSARHPGTAGEMAPAVWRRLHPQAWQQIRHRHLLLQGTTKNVQLCERSSVFGYAVPELLTMASNRKRLEEDICWIVSHVLPPPLSQLTPRPNQPKEWTGLNFGYNERWSCSLLSETTIDRHCHHFLTVGWTVVRAVQMPSGWFWLWGMYICRPCV